jgi:hypothetical protein
VAARSTTRRPHRCILRHIDAGATKKHARIDQLHITLDQCGVREQPQAVLLDGARIVAEEGNAIARRIVGVGEACENLLRWRGCERRWFIAHHNHLKQRSVDLCCGSGLDQASLQTVERSIERDNVGVGHIG